MGTTGEVSSPAPAIAIAEPMQTDFMVEGDFEGGLDNWTFASGWTIENGKLVSSESSGDAFIQLNDSYLADPLIFNNFEFESSVQFNSPGGEAHFLIRSDDQGNHYEVGLKDDGSNDEMWLIKKVNGLETELARIQLTDALKIKQAQMHDIQIRTVDDLIEVRIDNVLVISERDRKFRSGSVGIKTVHTEAHFDDIQFKRFDRDPEITVYTAVYESGDQTYTFTDISGVNETETSDYGSNTVTFSDFGEKRFKVRKDIPAPGQVSLERLAFNASPVELSSGTRIVVVNHQAYEVTGPDPTNYHFRLDGQGIPDDSDGLEVTLDSVDYLIRDQDGVITLERTPGKWATFTVDLLFQAASGDVYEVTPDGLDYKFVNVFNALDTQTSEDGIVRLGELDYSITGVFPDLSLEAAGIEHETIPLGVGTVGHIQVGSNVYRVDESDGVYTFNDVNEILIPVISDPYEGSVTFGQDIFEIRVIDSQGRIELVKVGQSFTADDLDVMRINSKYYSIETSTLGVTPPPTGLKVTSSPSLSI